MDALEAAIKQSNAAFEAALSSRRTSDSFSARSENDEMIGNGADSRPFSADVRGKAAKFSSMSGESTSLRTDLPVAAFTNCRWEQAQAAVHIQSVARRWLCLHAKHGIQSRLDSLDWKFAPAAPRRRLSRKLSGLVAAFESGSSDNLSRSHSFNDVVAIETAPALRRISSSNRAGSYDQPRWEGVRTSASAAAPRRSLNNIILKAPQSPLIRGESTEPRPPPIDLASIAPATETTTPPAPSPGTPWFAQASARLASIRAPASPEAADGYDFLQEELGDEIQQVGRTRGSPYEGMLVGVEPDWDVY